MLRIPYLDKNPAPQPGSRIASNATLVGDVTVERGASIWYGAVLRGDLNPIHIGAESNVQDNAVVHVDGRFPTSVGRQTAVGHNAVLHGCTVGDNCLIGMGAILLNGCVIGDHCIIGAGALVTQGTIIPPGSLVVGSPAMVKRPLNEKEIAMLDHNYQEYVHLSQNQLPETP